MTYRSTRQKIVDIIAFEVNKINPEAEVLVDFNMPTAGGTRLFAPFTVSVQENVDTLSIPTHTVSIEATHSGNRIEIAYSPGKHGNSGRSVTTIDREDLTEYIFHIVQHLCTGLLPLTPIEDAPNGAIKLVPNIQK